MNSLVNYFLEANLMLLVFLLLYTLLLRSESDFRTLRGFMLAATLLSLVLPLIHINPVSERNIIPSLQNTVALNWLPVVEVQGDHAENNSNTPALNRWGLIAVIYLGGVAFLLSKFIYQTLALRRLILNSNREFFSGYSVARIAGTQTFSFFSTICIGTETAISKSEQDDIIKHELVHVRQYHSLDILLASIIRIVFWFNPFVYSYKKIFVQLHEFEADARAVENSDVNRYCNLLARVAIQSAGLSLANHFNNSLTVKRIEMMRTLKSKLRPWKAFICATVFPLMFVVIACQDQIDAVSNNELPKDVQAKFTDFKKNYPGETFVVEYNEKANKILGELQQKHGAARHIEFFTSAENEESRTYCLIQYEGKAPTMNMPSDGGIYTVVEVQPEFPGGYDKMVEFISNNLKYPKEARMKGLEGTSYVEFVVEKDGSITHVQPKKGFDAACDAESVRVINSFPKWIPGKQDGENVAVRFVIPIRFKLN